MEPNSVINDMDVPSCIGLLKRSAKNTVMGTVTPFVSQDFELNVPTDMDMLSWSGGPVEIDTVDDCVVSAVLLATVPVTFTVPGTVPLCRIAVTSPDALLVPEAENRDTPPRLELKAKLTTSFCNGLPELSKTVNVNVAVSGKVAVPVFLSAICDVDAEVNEIIPAVGAATVTVPVAVIVPLVLVVVAVMTSPPMHV